jgi:hypothetical protein
MVSTEAPPSAFCNILLSHWPFSPTIIRIGQFGVHDRNPLIFRRGLADNT